MEEKPEISWHVEAHALAVESQISSVGRLAVDMADKAVHVADG